MASRYEIPAEFTVGADVVRVNSYGYNSTPTLRPGKIVKRTATQITVEVEGNGGTFKERYVADYATREQKSLDEYGQKNSYSRASNRIYLADSPVLASITQQAEAKKRQSDVRNAANEFAKQQGNLTVEAAAELMHKLDAFIQAEHAAKASN